MWNFVPVMQVSKIDTLFRKLSKKWLGTDLLIPLEKSIKVLVLNEVDKLSREAQHSLRRPMENYSSSCRLILCCNSSSRFTEAVRSNCLYVRIGAQTQDQKYSEKRKQSMAGTYEVFLSFRGKDTRQGFTDYLYNDLVSAGVNTFRDDNELRVGEEIGPELIKAITHSKISIPVFSKNYAESKWCLRELSLMVERKQNWGQKIFPIFYNVDPWEVQHYERGSYSEYFLQFDDNSSLDQSMVQEWKNALAVVGELKGLELGKESNWLEGSFVKKIVQKVLLELKKGKLNLPKNLVGMDHHVERLNELLLSRSESIGVKMIGILGMSGLGKTTIAKAIYNQLYQFFDSHCFLHDVRGELQRGGLLNLQKQLLRKILKSSNLDVDGVDEGSEKIKDAIRNKKVLLVLDNVDDMSKIEELLVMNHSLYGGGSRIIITTTNEEVLLAIKVQCERNGKFGVCEKYEPRLMVKEDALKLFSKSAFMRESPPDDYLDLAKEVISHAGGLPLVLETLGSSLSIEVNKVYWKEKLDKLREVPPIEVVERLKISYDALDFGQKQIFLDIACYFVGHGVTNPSYMWNACGFHASEGIRALERRSLIKFITRKINTYGIEEDEQFIWMHDQLRELGKEIINKSFANPLEWSRLWIQCEVFERSEEQWRRGPPDTICRFNEPFFFLAHGASTNYFSRRIKVVRSDNRNWEDLCLRVTGQEFEMLPNLRYLDISNFDLVGDFKGPRTILEWIRWLLCSGNSTPSNLYLKNIIILDLSRTEINHGWKWWNEIKMAEKLEVLIVGKNRYLTHVPHLSNLGSLKRLDLQKCFVLRTLDGLEQLGSLTYLNLSYCSNLEALPDLSKLRRLCTLNMRGLSKLVMVHGLETLELLELLDVMSCKILQRLPDFSNLRNLKRLRMLDCCAVEIYPDVSNSKKLTTLVKYFSEVSEVERLGELKALEHLEIYFAQCLFILPQLSKLTKLRELQIYGCCDLIEIPSLRGLESLKSFHMICCSTVRRTTFADLKVLKYVEICQCEKLTDICGLEDIYSLEMLDLRMCDSIEKLPDLSGLENLWCIQLYHCKKLTEIRGVEQLTSSTRLNIFDCESLVKNLPSFVIHSEDRCVWPEDLAEHEDKDEPY